jgi:hypothetical protein
LPIADCHSATLLYLVHLQTLQNSSDKFYSVHSILSRPMVQPSEIPAHSKISRGWVGVYTLAVLSLASLRKHVSSPNTKFGIMFFVGLGDLFSNKISPALNTNEYHSRAWRGGRPPGYVVRSI